MATMTMPFGQHRGKTINKLPTDYIEWCLENLERMTPDLQRALQEELADREAFKAEGA